MYLCLQAMRAPGKLYDRVGFVGCAYGKSEDPLVAALCNYAGERVNHVWMKNDVQRAFTIHPSRRTSDSALAAASEPASIVVRFEHIFLMP